MIYKLIQFEYGSPVDTGYAEYDNGFTELNRYTDLSGNTLTFDGSYGGHTIDENPPFPSWGEIL